MNTDGYSRAEKFKIYSADQAKLTARLKEIAVELNSLPKIPGGSVDYWIESLSDFNERKFSINTFSQHFKIKKEYTKLIEQAESNLRQLRLLAIEELLEKIDTTLNKSDQNTTTQ